MNQLVYIEENKSDLSRLFSSTMHNMVNDYKFLDSYLSTVRNFVTDIENGSLNLDKVIIGCQVSILYVESNEMDDYVICFPEYTKPEDGLISFHSPLGKQLLLKPLGERFEIQTPGGEEQIEIISIEFQDLQLLSNLG